MVARHGAETLTIRRKEKTMARFELQGLPYAMDALEPVISRKTLEFHHGKHHAGYVATLNGLVGETAYAGMGLEALVRAAAAQGDTAVFHQAAQVWNHAFYWDSLAPEGKGGEPEGELAAALAAAFGGVEGCRAALVEAATKRFGSGWAWLVRDGDGRVRVESTSNADTPLIREGTRPLLTIDVWEHAYYLDWQNRRADYAKALAGKLLNWRKAMERWA